MHSLHSSISSPSRSICSGESVPLPNSNACSADRWLVRRSSRRHAPWNPKPVCIRCTPISSVRATLGYPSFMKSSAYAMVFRSRRAASQPSNMAAPSSASPPHSKYRKTASTIPHQCPKSLRPKHFRLCKNDGPKSPPSTTIADLKWICLLICAIATGHPKTVIANCRRTSASG